MINREHDIEILTAGTYGCTRKEAEKYLNNGTIVFTAEDFENNYESYVDEWGGDEEEKEKYRQMIEAGDPVTDWEVKTVEGVKYYIMYAI